MKHILNDLSEQEKNRIREQHTGGMNVMTESFSRLLNAKLGNAKPLISEQEGTTNFDKNYFMGKKTGTVNFDDYGFPTTVDGIQITDYDNQWKNNFTVKNIGGRGFQGGDYKWTYSDKVSSGAMAPGQEKPGISITDTQNQVVGTLQF